MGNDWQTLFGAQFTVFGLAWLLAARYVPQERGPLCCWGVYALLQAAHHLARPWLGGSPSAVSGLLLYGLSLWGSLLGALGVDLFLNRRPRHLRLWVGLALAGGLLPAMLRAAGAPPLLCAVWFNTATVAALWGPLALFARPVSEEFGSVGRAMLGVLALAGVAPLVRTVALLADPSLLASGPTPASLKTLLPALMIGLVLQLIFLAMLVSRLMTRLRRLARHDGLTGLLNRTAFGDAVHQAWAAGRRRQSPLSVAFLDIDHFKRINDLHGHAAGDDALKAVAQVLREQARAVDRVARLGGEEFVVLMPDTDAQGVLQAAQRLQADLRQRQLPLPAGTGVLTVSIGVCTVTNFDADPSVLLDLADQAMYQAKRQGRDQIAVSPGLAATPRPPAASGDDRGLSAC